MRHNHATRSARVLGAGVLEWVQTAGAGGGLAAILWSFWRFHLSAVRAYRTSAEQWNEAYKTERAINRELVLQNSLLRGQTPAPSLDGGGAPSKG